MTANPRDGRVERALHELREIRRCTLSGRAEEYITAIDNCARLAIDALQESPPPAETSDDGGATCSGCGAHWPALRRVPVHGTQGWVGDDCKRGADSPGAREPTDEELRAQALRQAEALRSEPIRDVLRSDLFDDAKLGEIAKLVGLRV